MSDQINEIRKCSKEIEKPSGNENKIKIKKMVKFKDDKKKVIHNKGIFDKVISKELINKVEEFGFSKKDTDNIVFKVPKMLPKKNSISNVNHTFMRRRAKSISKSLIISSQRDRRSSQEI
uniref:Uncharacterized protein n=1 Tax=Strongyloides venezuelensis TaxID=75913 RepID=A0A0K0FH78_STRVS